MPGNAISVSRLIIKVNNHKVFTSTNLPRANYAT